MPTESSGVSLIFRALRFAAECHRDQRRKGGGASPYINHLIDVAEILWTIGGVRDIVTIAASILHDTVEDTDVDKEVLAEEFGEEITGIVLEVTDDKSLPQDKRKRLQVEHATLLSPQAALIKIADKASNIRDIAASPPTDWSINRRHAYIEWGEDVVERIRGSNTALESYFDEVCDKARASLTV